MKEPSFWNLVLYGRSVLSMSLVRTLQAIFTLIGITHGLGSSVRGRLDVRLQNGPMLREGRVEVKVNRVWGNVCDDTWDIRDANIVCIQLGYPLGALTAIKGSEYGDGDGSYTVCQAECSGVETSLSECELDVGRCPQCVRGEAAGLICREHETKCQDGYFKCRNDRCVLYGFVCDGDNDCKDGSDEEMSVCEAPLEVRLVGGRDNRSGRVEIKFLGKWGTVCDDTFDDNDAQVVCRSLGFEGPSTAHGGALFGKGNGIIWLDGLHCSGTEENIGECPKLKWAQHNCQHSEDAGVSCFYNAQSSLRMPVQCGKLQDQGNSEHYKININQKTSSEFDDFIMLPLSQKNPRNSYGPKYKIAKLVGSEEATSSASFPWIADLRIRFKGESKHRCGASIISEYFVISAAHCVSEFRASDYIVRVAEFNQYKLDKFEDDFEVQHIKIHKMFNQGLYYKNDIALMKLKPKAGYGIKFSNYVQPICLPTYATPYLPGMMCTIAGWGATENKTTSPILRLARVPLLSTGQCKYFTDYGVDRLSPGMLCAGDIKGGSDACQADSGGPLAVKINDRWTLLGIISWGHGCGEARKPGVYTNVQYYLEWISLNMKIMHYVG